MRAQRSVWHESVRLSRTQIRLPWYLPVTKATCGPETICEQATPGGTGANGRSSDASFRHALAA
jgi:hypothetical protein